MLCRAASLIVVVPYTDKLSAYRRVQASTDKWRYKSLRVMYR